MTRLLLAALVVPAVAAAHPAGFRHRHSWPAYREFERPPRDRVHFFLGGGVLVAPVLYQQAPDRRRPGRAGPGGGGALLGGVRVGPVLALEFGYAETVHETDEGAAPEIDQLLDLRSVDFTFKLHVPTRAVVEPFFLLGLGGAVLADQRETLATGGSVDAGAGLDVWVHPNLTLGARVRLRRTTLETAYGQGSDVALGVLAAGLDVTGHF
jgi:hypothetical protein